VSSRIASSFSAAAAGATVLRVTVLALDSAAAALKESGRGGGGVRGGRSLRCTVAAPNPNCAVVALRSSLQLAHARLAREKKQRARHWLWRLELAPGLLASFCKKRETGARVSDGAV